jgi:hypothetical protein
MHRKLILSAAILSLCCAGAFARGIDVDKINGSIHIENGQQAGDLGTINGGIHIESGGSAEKVSTVNGGIHLGKGADISGHASNVNGGFTLDAAHIGGGIETVSGDISVGADSRIEGGILVDKQHGWSMGKARTPRIVIGPHAVVTGTLEFRREVELLVSDSAKVGTITGATAKTFSGDRP